MKNTTETILLPDDAQDIANEIGFRGDIMPDVLQANNYSGGRYAEAERLFRGYMVDYVGEARAEECMLSGTGYGFRD